MQAIEKRNSLFNSLTQAVFDKDMASFWLQKNKSLMVCTARTRSNCKKRIRSS